MDVFDISACAIAVAKVLEAHGTPVSEIDKVLAAAREVAMASTVVRVTEEKSNLAAAIRDTLSKVAAERSIRQQASLETNLVRSLGDSKLKKIGQQISGVLLENGLTKSPDTCSDLFRYMESIVWDWNEV